MGIGRLVAAVALTAAVGLGTADVARAQAAAGERALLGRGVGNVLLRAEGAEADAVPAAAGRLPHRDVDRVGAGARALLGSSGGWRFRAEPAGGDRPAAATDAERALLGRRPAGGAGAPAVGGGAGR